MCPFRADGRFRSDTQCGLLLPTYKIHRLSQIRFGWRAFSPQSCLGDSLSGNRCGRTSFFKLPVFGCLWISRFRDNTRLRSSRFRCARTTKAETGYLCQVLRQSDLPAARSSVHRYSACSGWVPVTYLATCGLYAFGGVVIERFCHGPLFHQSSCHL
jgi:hypothetical protein